MENIDKTKNRTVLNSFSKLFGYQIRCSTDELLELLITSKEHQIETFRLEVESWTMILILGIIKDYDLKNIFFDHIIDDDFKSFFPYLSTEEMEEMIDHFQDNIPRVYDKLLNTILEKLRL